MRASVVALLFGCGCVAAADKSTDPVVVAPTDYRVLFENETVRVLDHRMAPKAKEARHFHPPRVTVNLTPQHLKVTLDGGQSLERETAAGVAAWRGAEFHAVESMSDAESHDVVIELKEAAAGLATIAAWSDLPGAREAQGKHPDVARIALSGSRDQPGRFAERVRLGDGYIAPPRVHSQELHVTVLAGRLCVGYGTRVVRHEAHCHGPGDYFVVPAGEIEFEWADGETILQVDGAGPLAVTSAPEGGSTKAPTATPPERSPAPPSAVEAPPTTPTPPPPSSSAPEPKAAAVEPPLASPAPPAAPPAPVALRSTPDAALKHVNAAGYDFAYLERGEGAPLVLLHGRVDDYRAFETVVNALSKNYRVIVPSRRYHFPNATPASGRYALDQHADDVAAIISALGLDSADVIGVGYGANVALAAAVRHPQRIKRVVMVEPRTIEMLSDPKVAKALLDRDRALLAEAAKTYTAEDPSAAMRSWIDAGYGGGSFDAAPAARREQWLDNAATLKLEQADPPGIDCVAAGAVAAPILIVRGVRAPDANRAIGRAAERCMRKAQTLDIADAGQDPQIDQPAGFVAGIAEFLK